ncbi:MAG TPA: serine/threonine-protein kinase [Pyrinomonadaceae bacterium]|jgi:predicted Ser/Thr protein kinase|nr:serine/threonine-protein kinase [Pyrinomonadaceae bacterium]
MDVPHIIAGRFRIECEIGRGGMGTVYRATHLGLERPVAVKIIKTEYASDPHVTDRFLREARTMARLRHQHAAMIFDAGNLPDGRHFIVMEFVEGATLSETLMLEGRFTPERAVRIASDICDVLAEAHGLGIIHRDLKPSNIILNERGVCVLDFGVAKVLATTSTDKISTHATTGSGAIVGTPRYMSPEQCMGQRVEARSDLYSLGVLLYEMLSGRPPFVDALASAVLVKQATSRPQSLSALREDLPQSLVHAVHTLLAKQPEDRPRSAVAARALLEKSIVQPERARPDLSPLATTVSAVGAGMGAGRSIIFRAVMPLMVIAVLGLLLLVWGRSGQNMLQTATLERDAEAASRDSLATSAGAPVILPSALSLDEARRVVSAASHGPVSDVRVLRKGRASAIVSIHDEQRAGTTHLFMMERGAAGRFRVTGRAPLDMADFRGASWTAETVNADGDGSDEVLYTGTKVMGRATSYRLVLYVTRTRRSYALRIENVAPDGKTLRARLSPNALSRAAAPYRTTLQQHARMIAAAR